MLTGSSVLERKIAIGAEVIQGKGVSFRVWSPDSRDLSVVLEPEINERLYFKLEREEGGYYSGTFKEAGEGMRYYYHINRTEPLYPDPASRFQPEGPSGPSEIINPAGYHWSDRGWQGIEAQNQILYEMHIGTFTREGTWLSAIPILSELAQMGITAIEVMPVNDFTGDFGWGYDGVDLFAPTRLYGRPDDMRDFISAAHNAGIGVILDVVYNHLGPSGNFLKAFSPAYFTNKYRNEWGEAINFDGPDSQGVREFFTSNAACWISEYHLDGLRLDATHTIFDSSKTHILAEISKAARRSAGGRNIILVAENETQEVRHIVPLKKNGYGLDMMWNDDFHHSAMVALTSQNLGYYTDYRGKPQEFISCAKRGTLFQGQFYKWQKKRRGTPSRGLDQFRFVWYLQNHDQVANSLEGKRVGFLTSPGKYRALTALLLLAPGTPLIFQGQEFGSSSPFLYFSNINPELAETVFKGRIEFLKQFCNLSQLDLQDLIARPEDIRTFQRCKLDQQERENNNLHTALYRDLIRLRKTELVFSTEQCETVDGAVLGTQSFVLRFFARDTLADRLLIINLGLAEHFFPSPEPLLAPVRGMAWQTLWSSEDPIYGGAGISPVETAEGWHLAGEAAVLLKPTETTDTDCEK